MGAHPDTTWTAKRDDSEATSPYVNWLTDDNMLPKIVPNARIMGFGYKSQWFGDKSVDTSIVSVSDTAARLLAELETYWGVCASKLCPYHLYLLYKLARSTTSYIYCS
jgi:hypothetical protein